MKYKCLENFALYGTLSLLLSVYSLEGPEGKFTYV